MDSTERINLMSVTDLYVTFDDHREILVHQNARMLVDLYREMSWERIGKEVSPLESWCFCVWWALQRDEPALLEHYEAENWEQLSESIVRLDASLPKEGQR